jgi:hypothetical protein
MRMREVERRKKYPDLATASPLHQTVFFVTGMMIPVTGLTTGS